MKKKSQYAGLSNALLTFAELFLRRKTALALVFFGVALVRRGQKIIGVANRVMPKDKKQGELPWDLL